MERMPQTMPRVVVVLKRPMGAGGLQIQARTIALRLCEAGVPCTLLVHARSPRETRQIMRRGWPTRIIECRSHILFHLRLVRELWGLRGQYDVVHVHGFGREAITAAVGTRLAGRWPLILKPGAAGPGTRLGAWA